MIRELFVLNMKALLSGVLRIRPATGTSRGVNKSKTGRTTFAVVVGVVVAASFFVMFFGWFYTILEPYYSAGIGFMYFSMLAVTVFALCVFSTIFTATSVVFGAKDNELLLSMPIKPSAILISRLSVMLAFEYAFTLIAALAALITWAAGGYATTAGLLFFVIGVILLPPMALSVALLLAWVLSLVSGRLRYKNIITLLISVGFFAGYLYVYMNIQSYLGELVAKGTELAEAFRKSMPPFYAFGVSVADGDAVNGLVFAAWAILPFAAALLLLAANYNKILTTNKGGTRVVYRAKRVAPKSVLYALTAKEMAKYWSKPTIIMNSSSGSVFMLILSVALFEGDGVFSLLAPITQMTNINFVSLLAAILAFLGSANGLGASLVSLEGKNLWIVKSVPVSAQTILRAKILAHLLSSSIPCLFASVCAGVTLANGPTDWLLLLIVPQTIIALIAVLGLALNLYFPKLDWTNEVYVVKQGVSAMITMFGGMGIFIVLVLLYAVALTAVLSITAYLWICGAFFCLAGACVYAWLMNKGARMFAEL
jgi:ABC-2 type transport system permease protein